MSSHLVLISDVTTLEAINYILFKYFGLHNCVLLIYPVLRNVMSNTLLHADACFDFTC